MTCSLEMPGSNIDQDTKYPQNFRGFPQSLQTNYWKVSPIEIRPLPFTSFLLLYSLVFLLFDLIHFIQKRLQTLRKVCSTNLNKQISHTRYKLLRQYLPRYGRMNVPIPPSTQDINIDFPSTSEWAFCDIRFQD